MILELIKIHIVADDVVRVIGGRPQLLIPRPLWHLTVEQLSIHRGLGRKRLERDIAAQCDTETSNGILFFLFLKRPHEGEHIGRPITGHKKRLHHLDRLHPL